MGVNNLPYLQKALQIGSDRIVQVTSGCRKFDIRIVIGIERDILGKTLEITNIGNKSREKLGGLDHADFFETVFNGGSVHPFLQFIEVDCEFFAATYKKSVNPGIPYRGMGKDLGEGFDNHLEIPPGKLIEREILTHYSIFL